MKKTSISLSLFIVFTSTLLAQVFTPKEMPNVQVADRNQYVSDPANLLPGDVKQRVNQRLSDLRKVTSVEAVVAIPPSIGDETIEDWSEELFTSWGIGKKDKDNGVLLVISPESRRARIQTGYGVEGVLTDIACNNIIGREVIPNMKEGNLAAAVDQATQMMCQALTDPAVADELRSKQADNYGGNVQTLSAEVIWQFIQIIAGCLFFFGFTLFCVDLNSSHKKGSNYEKSQLWRSHLTTYLWTGILSLGTGLIFYLLALFIYRSKRTARLKCPTCGAKMNRLSEEEDNQLLSDSQDFEEKLNTVDYDVWECPKCGTVERFPYKTKQTKYSECPNCHTIAMCLKRDVIRRKPTSRQDGLGVKEYECEFCHHRKEESYKIPKEDPSAAILGAAVGAALSSRGGGGGGGFGGGFGGGSTGGGGASGGW